MLKSRAHGLPAPSEVVRENILKPSQKILRVFWIFQQVFLDLNPPLRFYAVVSRAM